MKLYPTLVRVLDNAIVHENLQTPNNAPFIAEMLEKREYKWMHLTIDERSKMPVLALDNNKDNQS